MARIFNEREEGGGRREEGGGRREEGGGRREDEMSPDIHERYGSGASLHSGIMAFSSYRDPHIDNTIKVIDNSLEWVNKNTFSDQVLFLTLPDLL